MQCTDNSQCQKVVAPPGQECYDTARHTNECGSDGYCWIVVRDPEALCECWYDGTTFVDSCARGTPASNDYDIWCVYSCDGDTSGNGKCDASQDYCKAP
ncbi:hypothetical protein CERZMDRAFT_96260 [Cercospora zeae-maydis SCOH1-5]|uniref:Uncharacterized protein n=1 Tax=Cercospora zeae-maydis SCOH1-5 TaxID=717836 RepID=A0A6A6FJ26_9PEZI|nr:hypothetical protein CERZMDRAFT_96260 [Cercospora zeae-maydis SCOH1-5]